MLRQSCELVSLYVGRGESDDLDCICAERLTQRERERENDRDVCTERMAEVDYVWREREGN